MVGLFLGFALKGSWFFLRDAKVVDLNDELGGCFFKNEGAHFLGRGT